MLPKTAYEDALIDVKKLREIAVDQARALVLKDVEPRIKELVEQQLFSEGDEAEEDEMDEASVVADVAGTVAKPEDEADECDEQYEIAEGSEESLAALSDLVRPVTDNRFVMDVYGIHEHIQQLATSNKADKQSGDFIEKLDNTISKLTDMYVYLKESYVGENKNVIEDKLEKSYDLVKAIRESTMKMRDLLSEDGEILLKVSGMPDDTDVDALNIDIITDEEAPADEAAPEGDAAAAPADAAAPMPPQMEADEMDEDEMYEGDGSDEMIEISESDLRSELKRLRSLRESDVASTFGDGDDKGHPEKDKVSDIDDVELSEADEDAEEADVNEADVDEAAIVAAVAETSQKMESARQRLSRASKRLSEARGTDRETVARSMYRSAVRAYRTVRDSINESSKNKVPANAVKNTASGKRLAEESDTVKKLNEKLTEANLLNAKLIHANKLLRIEGLTKAQQALVIDRLDEARNLREVRLISESLSKALKGGSKSSSLKESAVRRPSGSASRPSKSSGTSEVLNEGLETQRWATLAGLK